MTINYEYQINSTNYNPATTTFYWRVVSRGAGGGGTAGVVVDDFDTSSGSTLSGGNITTIQVGVKERTGTEGTRNYTLQASTSATFASNVVTKDFQVTDGVAATPVYNSISRSTTSIPEDGATVVTFTVNTSNVIDGTKVGFTFSGTNITGSDFQYSFDNSNWSAGTTSNITNANGVTINSNQGLVYVRALADTAETADETLTITLNATDDASTSTGGLSQSVTISNTSAAPVTTYEIVTTGKTSLTEPTKTIHYPDTLNLTVVENVVQNVNSLDTVVVRIQDTSVLGGTIVTTAESNATVESTTGYSIGGYVGVFDFTAQENDFEITFEDKEAGAYSTSFRGYNTIAGNPDGNTSTHTGSVTLVGSTTYTVNTTNFSTGTLYWQTDGGTAVAADFVDGYTDNGSTVSLNGNNLRGQVNISSNTGSFEVRINANTSTNSNRTFNLKLYNDPTYTFGPVETSELITINNTAVGYNQITADQTTINETTNRTATITVSTNNIPDGTNYGWDITGTAATNADYEWSSNNSIWFEGQTYPITGGIFQINSNTDTIYIRAKEDAFTDAGESLTLTLRQFDAAGNSTYVSGSPNAITINITDTSQTAAASTVAFSSLANPGTNGTIITNGVSTGGTYSYSSWQALGAAEPATTVPTTVAGRFVIRADGRIEGISSPNSSGAGDFQWIQDRGDLAANGGSVASNLYEYAVELNTNTINGDTNNTTGFTLTDPPTVGLQSGAQSGWTWRDVPASGSEQFIGISKVANLNDSFEGIRHVNIYIREKANTSNVDSITVKVVSEAVDAGQNA